MEQPDVLIAGVGTALPGPRVDNAALARRFGMPVVWQQWVDTFVGTRSRHLAVDLETGEVRCTLTEMAATAAHRALTSAGVEPGEVDLVVMGSASPESLMPATVNLVADRLGIDGVPTYQLLSGCTGAIQALAVAFHLVRSGTHRTALVLGGDSWARLFDPDRDVAGAPAEVQVNLTLFGDGAGAAVLRSGPAPVRPALRHVFHRLVGRGRAPGQVVELFSRPEHAGGREPVVEDFKAVEAMAPAMAVDALQELLDRVGWEPTDLDYVLPPQLSGRMTARVLDTLSMPWAEEVSCVTEIANTVNALPFFQLEMLLARMGPGERAAGLSVEASKWIRAGYAVELPAVEPEDV